MTNEEIIFLKSLTSKIDSVNGADVNKIFKIAEEHIVLPLVYDNIMRADGFDEGKYIKLRQKVFSLVYSQAKKSAGFKKLYVSFLNNGIKPIVIKGIICRNLYKDKCDYRPSSDEDIYIKSCDYFKVRDILEENGYMPEIEANSKTLKNIQEVDFKNADTNLQIEVHLNLIGKENRIRRLMNDYFENVDNKCIEMEIDGQIYYTLDYTQNYIFLIYHLFKHFSTAGVGVRQVLDILKFAEEYKGKINWEEVYSAISDIGIQSLYGDILEIGNKYMGFSIENPFGEKQHEKLLEDMFFSGAFGNSTLEKVSSRVKVIMAMDSGGKFGVIRTLFPTIEYMREFYTVLNKHPYLLPVMWIVRMVRYIFRLKQGKTYNLLKSDKIANKKIQLLKDYNII